MDLGTFPKIGKTEHIGHEAFLLAVASGNSQYVLAPVIPAQQKMAEILISIPNKTVVAETAVFSAQGAAVGWFDLTTVCKLAIVKRIIGNARSRTGRPWWSRSRAWAWLWLARVRPARF